MKKILSALLCAAMLIGAASCGTDAYTGAEARTVSETTAAETEETRRDNYPDSLPADLNFNGKKYILNYYEDNKAEWIAEALNGETINDAVYKRNLAVSERLNVDLEFFYAGTVADYWDNKINDNIRASILAGNGAYNIIAGYASYITRQMNGCLTNLYDVKYLDFDKPWWIQDLISEITVKGKMFHMTGDLGMSVLMNMDVVFYNETLSQSLFGELFYNTVFDGGWTLDKAGVYIGKASADINGDGKLDADNDRAGLMLFDKYSGCDAFLGGFRQPVTKKNSDGIPELCVNNERTVKIVEKLYEIFHVKSGAYLPTVNHPASEQHSMTRFAAGDCLLFLDWLRGAENKLMREMENEWGILPIPKLDEAQEDYGVHLNNSYSLFCIPVDCKDIDMTGAVTEALAAESYRNLTNAYYEVALQTKYARNDETVQVLELIRPLISTNYGIVYSVIGASLVLRNTVMVGSKDVSSWYAKNEGTMKAKLAEVLTVYE